LATILRLLVAFPRVFLIEPAARFIDPLVRVIRPAMTFTSNPTSFSRPGRSQTRTSSGVYLV
jgi:hypothetical protein